MTEKAFCLLYAQEMLASCNSLKNQIDAARTLQSFSLEREPSVAEMDLKHHSVIG
jgi:hypothetical protein